jgi:(1->4)-alpha-D-glucan 1-alpha-D-glucosylmutase
LNAIIRKQNAPSPADEIMLYETLVAAWPLGLAADDAEGITAFTERVAAWQIKSLREAKLFSEWAAPNEDYEGACREFLNGTLDPTRAVLAEIIAFAQRLGLPGAINGLAQNLLRLTTPGVPDLYQGTDFWDQSLVDPDNRRPVDYAAREKALAAGTAPAEVLPGWQSGAVKQAIIERTLAFRAAQSELFAHGDYRKLEAEGPAAAHVLAFTRQYRGKILVAAVTRLAANFNLATPLVPPTEWADTFLDLPSGGLEDVLNGGVIAENRVGLQRLFEKLPVALLALR